MKILPTGVVRWLRRKAGRPGNVRNALERLDGALLEKRTPNSWRGSFEGAITIENIRDDDGQLHFDLLLPTSESDFDDFIQLHERQSGTTEKVLLTEGRSPIPGARIVRISREGKLSRLREPAGWNFADAEQYRLTYVVGRESLEASESLEVHVRSLDDHTQQWSDIAIASAARTKRS